MLKSFSNEPVPDPVPQQPEDKPVKPVGSRGAMRFPGDQPEAPPSPPPHRSATERSAGQQN